MKIAIDDKALVETGLDPSKAYADACWRRNPRISPDSWRLHGLAHGGVTVGKLWLDAQVVVPTVDDLERLVGEGLNGLVVSGETAAEVLRALAALKMDRRALLVAMVILEEVPEVLPEVDVVLWGHDVQRADAVWQAGFARFEQQVADGRLQGYGAALSAPVDVARLWPLAQAAAAQAWGRRRRPAWRALLLPLGVGRLGMLREAVCDDVSVLEWAARREMLVLASGSGDVQLPDGTVAPEMDMSNGGALPTSLSALMMEVEEAEVGLMRVLGGWPHVTNGGTGAPLFSVVQHVQLDLPLWPGVAALQRWRAQVWPGVQQAWQAVAAQQPALAGDVGAYLALLAQLDSQGETLATWSAAYLGWRTGNAVLEQGMQGGGLRWQRAVDDFGAAQAQQSMAEANDQAIKVVAASIVASVPGVGGVLGTWTPEQVRTAMALPGLADVGRVLA